MNVRISLAGLSLLSSVLLSLPFIVPHTGFLALAGFIPLLCMERIASISGVRRVWIFHYGSFVLWNAFTTFWVCNATVGGGIFAVLANAFQMSLIFGAFRFSKKYLGGVLPYIFLAAIWIAWERAYFDAEISWPWLVLGNAFAGSTASVQWYEFTGTLGGSLWIWACNLLLFALMVTLSDGSWRYRFNAKARLAMIFSIVIVYTGPFVVSRVLYGRYEEKHDPVQVLVVQPNIDPYNKFQAMSQSRQNAILESQIKAGMAECGISQGDSASVLILAPETFTGDVVTGDLSRSMTFRRFDAMLKDYPGAYMLMGASSRTYIQSHEAPSYTARPVGEDRWVESHNSALLLDGDGSAGICHKNKLVVAVEKTPYPALLTKVDDLLGGVMGRCVGQDTVSVFGIGGIPFGCAICYESVYGEYFTEYVRKGAEFMTVITNDAWWGDTPGYRQHLSYSALRAIETRRSIARCANTGISAIIDQRGEILDATSWWEPAVLHSSVNRNSRKTFFVMYGDIVGRSCTFLFFLLSAALVVRMILSVRTRPNSGK